MGLRLNSGKRRAFCEDPKALAQTVVVERKSEIPHCNLILLIIQCLFR
jgi:hypothetical protein